MQERFNAMKCLKCNGALCNIKNSTYCLDCDDKSQIPLLNKIIQANKIFQISEVYINLDKPEKALDKLEKCLHIRKTVLYKYNEDITITLNLMAEMYKIMGLWIYHII